MFLNIFEPSLNRVLGQFTSVNQKLDRIIKVRLKRITTAQQRQALLTKQIMEHDTVAMQAKKVQANIQKLIEV